MHTNIERGKLREKLRERESAEEHAAIGSTRGIVAGREGRQVEMGGRQHKGDHGGMPVEC